MQALHRLEIGGPPLREKSLKNKSALKSTGKSLKSLEKSLNSTISVGLNTVDRDLKQYKIVVPLFGTNFLVLISPLSSISEVEF